MCKDDSPFYLSINYKHKPLWYKKLSVGIHIMRRDDEEAGKRWQSHKKPNHSARKTQVQTLCVVGVTDSACSACSFIDRRLFSELKPLQETISWAGEAHVSFAHQLPSIATVVLTPAVTTSSCCSTSTTTKLSHLHYITTCSYYITRSPPIISQNQEFPCCLFNCPVTSPPIISQN